MGSRLPDEEYERVSALDQSTNYRPRLAMSRQPQTFRQGIELLGNNVWVLTMH